MQYIHESKNSTPALHSLLWSIGKQLFTGQGAKPVPYTLSPDYGDAALEAKIRRTTVQQVATSLRMQGIEGEDDTMLSSLEQMALAGEISFSDFIGRVQNLFPRKLDGLDVTLQVKISSLLVAA